MAEARKTRRVADLIKSLSPRSLTTRPLNVDDATEGRPSAIGSGAPASGDPTRRVTQDEYDRMKAEKNKAAEEKYRAWKALKGKK